MKKAFIFVPLFFICISCGVLRNTGNSLKAVELGMSKSEVIKIIGNYYTLDEAYTDRENNKVEILGFRDLPDSKEIYQLVFVNNILKEWHKIYLHQHKTEK
jgi:hypothetical protein